MKLEKSITLGYRAEKKYQTVDDLLYGADGDTCSAGDYEMAVLDVWPDLIQNEGDDVGLHS